MLCVISDYFIYNIQWKIVVYLFFYIYDVEISP